MTHGPVHTTLDSPVGPLLLTARNGVLTGLHYRRHGHLPPRVELGERDDDGFVVVIQQLDAYFHGTLTDFDVPVSLSGTPFQRRVWDALREIPYGETASYGDVARRIGLPSAVRAVGAANGQNPIAIIVPCHRVIGADGTLTGYGGGLDAKRILLDLERPAPPQQQLHLLDGRPV